MQMESLNSDQMASKAQQIWAMLDDMAENDPAAYQKFIDQQMKEGRDNMTLPEPHMCVLVTMCVSKLFDNLVLFMKYVVVVVVFIYFSTIQC